MRIAIGPFSGVGGDDWPIVGHEQLAAEGFEIVPTPGLPTGDNPDLKGRIDATVLWSLEYQTVDPARLPGYRVAVVGDHHIHDPSTEGFDLVFGDLAYTRKHPEARYFRQFSFDPRLHRFTEGDSWEARDVDLAFYGRHDGDVRDALLQSVTEAARRRGWRWRLVYGPYQRGEEVPGYQHAKVAVNLAQRSELNMRAYEAAACGALSILQHDALAEVVRAKAPVPTYDPAQLEPFLAEWLADPVRWAVQVAAQQAWVLTERPVDHLRWLCRQIKEHMYGSERADDADVVAGSGGNRGASGGSGDLAAPAGDHPEHGDLSAAGLVGEPSLKEQADAWVLPKLSNAGVVGGVSGGVVREYVASLRAAARAAARAAVGDLEAEPPLNEQRQECVALVPPTAKRVLDIGCGAGGFGWALKQRNPAVEVTGVDMQDQPLARARLDRFCCWDVDDPVAGVPSDSWREKIMPFESDEDVEHRAWAQLGHYDVITCLDVLEHLRDPWTVLKRLRALLTPGGVLVVSAPNIRNVSNLHTLLVKGEWRYFRHGTMDFRGPHDNVLSWEHFRFFTRDSLDAMLRECGYQANTWMAMPFDPPVPGSPQERWANDLAYLAMIHGGDLEGSKAEMQTMQWLVAAKPRWNAPV